MTNRIGLYNIGVAHTDELVYLWDPAPGPLNTNDSQMMEVMTTAWSNFAKYGNPTPDSAVSIWTPQTSDSEFTYWNISDPRNMHMDNDPDFMDRMTFWDKMSM